MFPFFCLSLSDKMSPSPSTNSSINPEFVLLLFQLLCLINYKSISHTFHSLFFICMNIFPLLFFFSLSIFLPTQQSFSKSSLWFWIRLGFGLGFLEIIFKYSRDLKNESKIIFVGNKFSCFLDSDCRFDCRYFIYTQLHQRDGT